ncbi:hypothetical protein L195_g043836, partial [Trifolium pratense]
PLQNLLLFQYLVVVLESDFLPRNGATMNWSFAEGIFTLHNTFGGHNSDDHLAYNKDNVPHFLKVTPENCLSTLSLPPFIWPIS